MLAYIHEIGGGASGDRPDNALPGRPPGGGATLPVLPGIWPPPGVPNLPVPMPPTVENPIVIPDDPANPTPLPPGSVWPPLPPTTTGKYAILIWVLGVGHRWLIVDGSASTKPIAPPEAQPKK